MSFGALFSLKSLFSFLFSNRLFYFSSFFFFFLMMRRPPISTLFPYTPLFRSALNFAHESLGRALIMRDVLVFGLLGVRGSGRRAPPQDEGGRPPLPPAAAASAAVAA